MSALLGTDLSRRRLSSTMRIRLYPLNEEEEVPPPGTPPLNIPPRLPAREPRQRPSGSRCRKLAEALCADSFSISFSLFLWHVCESVCGVCACVAPRPHLPYTRETASVCYLLWGGVRCLYNKGVVV